jgi:Tol biopolymer transport system component
MPLSPGSRVAAYEIVGLIGSGGMGEVYRAHDSTLNRDVAVKVVPDLFANDPERLARFTREAQTLAALNHPNIAHIYGVESRPANGAWPAALVMELVDGQDLSAVIARGPMPIAEALPIARQIADALEAAHEQGIVHRDLKPGNIKIRADGTVKLLDFGLAKALTSDLGSATSAVSDSPTLTARATQAGLILGTAAYMAPEQARGKPVDRRADIWAFGLVLCEMLTGRRVIEGDEISDVLAAVLRQDIDFTRLPTATPTSVRRLLARCLERDPRKRLSAMGDARLELDEREAATAAPAAMGGPPVRSSLVSRVWPAAVAVVVTAVAAALLMPKPSPAPNALLTRLAVLPPPGEVMFPDSTGVAISPDGTMVAFVVGGVARSDSELWVRSLDSPTARRLENANGAQLPFWSPDSRRIGFFTPTKLETIAVAGGRPEVLADSSNGRGGAWTTSNLILFAPDANGPIYRIPASGGTPEAVTKVDAARKEYGHRFPVLLPDEDHFLFAALPGKAGKFDIFVASLKDGSRTLVGSMESAPTYADPGWLLSVRQGVLAAQKFDPKTRTLSGDPIPLGDEPTSILDPALSYTAGRAISVSSTGSLAYYSSPSVNTIGTWYDASGRPVGMLNLPPGHYETVTISPDGTRAIFVRSTSPSESTLWLIDLKQGGARPISSGHGRNDAAVWSPDGKRVVFAADRDGPQQVYIKNVDDAAPEQLLWGSDVLFKNPAAWSPDGQWILIGQLDPGTANDIWRLPASGTGELKLLVQGPTRDNSGPVSPDGHWLAYISDETGRFELYVQPFPEPGPKTQISQQGAGSACWTKDGRGLIFTDVNLRALWRADVAPGPQFRTTAPKQIATLPPGVIWVDAMPDRERFLALSPERTGIGSITIVENWLGALSKSR